MERWIGLVALTMATLLLAREASAGFQKGDDLLRNCRDISDSGYGLCVGYIEGVLDNMEAHRRQRHLPPCLPEDVDTGRVHNLVIDYLLANAGKRDQPADLLVVDAVTTEWRCADGGP